MVELQRKRARHMHAQKSYICWFTNQMPTKSGAKSCGQELPPVLSCGFRGPSMQAILYCLLRHVNWELDWKLMKWDVNLCSCGS